MRRVALTVLAVLTIALTGTASVRAADPGTIGGTLSAGGSTATLTSSGTIPVAVVMEGDFVTAEPATFTLAPGETVTMALTGPAEGTLAAHLSALAVNPAGDTATATLAVHLSPAVRPEPFPWQPIGLGLLVLIGLVLLARRFRPWRWRLVTAP